MQWSCEKKSTFFHNLATFFHNLNFFHNFISNEQGNLDTCKHTTMTNYSNMMHHLMPRQPSCTLRLQNARADICMVSDSWHTICSLTPAGSFAWHGILWLAGDALLVTGDLGMMIHEKTMLGFAKSMAPGLQPWCLILAWHWQLGWILEAPGFQKFQNSRIPELNMPKTLRTTCT